MDYKKGDLLEAFENGEVHALMHVANQNAIFGSGIASSIKRKFPSAYIADLAYNVKHNGSSPLGTFSKAEINNSIIYNLYGQIGIGNDGHPLNRNCSYDHLYNAVYKACEDMVDNQSHTRIGVPYGMGCVRAGGSWLIVNAILADIEEKFPVTFIVYDIENGEMKNQK